MNLNHRWLIWCWVALAAFVFSVLVFGCSKPKPQNHSGFHGEPQPKEWHPKKEALPEKTPPRFIEVTTFTAERCYKFIINTEAQEIGWQSMYGADVNEQKLISVRVLDQYKKEHPKVIK